MFVFKWMYKPAPFFVGMELWELAEQIDVLFFLVGWPGDWACV